MIIDVYIISKWSLVKIFGCCSLGKPLATIPSHLSPFSLQESSKMQTLLSFLLPFLLASSSFSGKFQHEPIFYIVSAFIHDPSHTVIAVVVVVWVNFRRRDYTENRNMLWTTGEQSAHPCKICGAYQWLEG